MKHPRLETILAAERETHTYTVVDNRYQGEGFAWVITDLPYGERWKYGLHGDFNDKGAADEAAAKLNRAWGAEEN